MALYIRARGQKKKEIKLIMGLSIFDQVLLCTRLPKMKLLKNNAFLKLLLTLYLYVTRIKVNLGGSAWLNPKVKDE